MATYASKICKFTQTEIKQLFDRSSAVARTQQYTLLSAPRTQDFARILLVLPKRVGNAVARNKLRRRVKAIFYQQGLCTRCQHDVVLIAKPELARIEYAELKDMLLKQLEKLC